MNVLFRVLSTRDDDAAAAAVASFTGDINERNWAQRTVVIDAILRRLRRAVKALGARGDCDVDLGSGRTFGAVHAAAINGMVDLVLEAFPHLNVNRQLSNGITALHMCCQRAAADNVKALLAHGADPTIVDWHGRTADVGVDPDLAAEFRQLFARATGDRFAWMRACVSIVNAF